MAARLAEMHKTIVPSRAYNLAFEAAAERGQGGDGWVRAVGGSGDILSKEGLSHRTDKRQEHHNYGMAPFQ